MHDQIGHMKELIDKHKEASEKMMECADDLAILADREADRRNSLRDEICRLEYESDTDLSDLNMEVLEICNDLGILNMVNPCGPSIQEIIKVIRFLAAKIK